MTPWVHVVCRPGGLLASKQPALLLGRPSTPGLAGLPARQSLTAFRLQYTGFGHVSSPEMTTFAIGIASTLTAGGVTLLEPHPRFRGQNTRN